MCLLFYRLRNLRLGEYNPVNVGAQRCAPAHAFGPKARNHYLLHYIKRGKGVFKNQNGTYSLSAGQCFVIRPGEMTYYQADAAEPWYYIWIGFTTETISGHIRNNDVLDIPFLESLFDAIEENYTYLSGINGENGVREAWLRGRITEIMTRIDLHYCRPAETKAKSEMRIVKNYIDTRLSSQLHIQEIADCFHLDRAYLSRKFKDAFGVSPQNYIVNARLSEAAKLMCEHGLSPTEASMSVGYSDIYLFSKMFKRKYGISPREYKKRG